MRFKRFEHFALNWTQRKAAAATRKQQREREAFPLFAEQIREEQPSIESVRAKRETDADTADQRFRAFRARQWRQVRAKLANIPTAYRLAVRAYWDGHAAFPGDPAYLAYVIRQYETSGLRGLGVCELSKPCAEELPPPGFTGHFR